MPRASSKTSSTEADVSSAANGAHEPTASAPSSGRNTRRGGNANTNSATQARKQPRPPRPKSSDDAALKQLGKNELLELYHTMQLIRRFEERSAEQYAYGKIGGFLHLYIGEEAVAVGAIHALRQQDHLITHYRDHGYALAIGADPGAAMAELFGKATGTTHGRGGSMHMTHTERQFWGGYAIVAGHIPIATGLGLAQAYQETDAVVMCIFGDGSTNAGAFHEALNMAKIWKTPVIFLCENNLYAMGTAYEYISAVPQMATKAAAYDIPAEIIDGQDVLAMYEATQRAIAHCTAGKGPYFLEAMTYRFRGHSMADPETYRDKAEVEQHRSTDPIEGFKQRLLQAKAADEADFERIDAEIEEQLEAAIKFADESPVPDPETMYDYIYSNGHDQVQVQEGESPRG